MSFLTFVMARVLMIVVIRNMVMWASSWRSIWRPRLLLVETLWMSNTLILLIWFERISCLLSFSPLVLLPMHLIVNNVSFLLRMLFMVSWLVCFFFLFLCIGYTGFTVGLCNNRTVYIPIEMLTSNSPRYLFPFGRYVLLLSLHE